MFRRISETLASEMIAAGVIGNDEKEVYQYSMEVSIAMLINVLSSLLLFVVFGRLLEGLVFLAAFFPLRTYSGGFHASSHLRCYLLSMGIIVVFLCLTAVIPAEWYYITSVSFALVSSLIIYLLTPVGTPNKRFDAKETIKYRKISLWIMSMEGATLVLLLIINHELLAFAVSIALAVSASSLILGQMDLKRSDHQAS